MYETRGELVIMGTGKDGNPLLRKNIRTIRQQRDSKVMKVRCHSNCQPNFCAFYGGVHWNCDGSRREGVEIPDHTVWAVEGYLGPEWWDVVEGTSMEEGRG